MHPVKHGDEPWDQLGGTAQPGGALQWAVRAVLLQIETVGKPLGSDHPNIEKRIDQLVAAAFQHPQIAASLLREKQPNRAHQAIVDGVAHKLNEMRETRCGRSAATRRRSRPSTPSRAIGPRRPGPARTNARSRS